MAIKYLKQLSENEIKAFANIVESSIANVDFFMDDDNITMHVEVSPFAADDDDEISGIVDTYVFDDYNIEAYDVALNEEAVFDYRKVMLARFGSQYAEDFLLSVIGMDL